MNSNALRLIGNVKDDRGDPLPFANIYYSTPQGKPSDTNIGTTANARGAYDLGNFVGSLHVTASHVGFQSQTRLIPMIPGTQRMDFNLRPGTTNLPAFEVTATTPQNWTRRLIIAALITLSIYGIYRLMKPRA